MFARATAIAARCCAARQHARRVAQPVAEADEAQELVGVASPSGIVVAVDGGRQAHVLAHREVRHEVARGAHEADAVRGSE